MIRDLLLNREIWDQVAIIDGDSVITYGELAQKACAVTDMLQKTGATGHIAILLPNNGDYAAAFFGIMMSGLTAFPLSVSLTPHEAAAALIAGDASAVITNSSLSAKVKSFRNVMLIEEVETGDGPLFETRVRPPLQLSQPEGLMLLLLTSGTTDNPKIVMLSENNVNNSILEYYDKMDFSGFRDGEIRSFICVPFSAIYGIFMLCAYAVRGITVILLPDGYTIDTLLRLTEKHKVTHYEGGTAIIPMLESTIGRVIPYDISSLRVLCFGGSAASADSLAKLIEAYPWMQFWQGYGMTEAAPMISKFRKFVPRDKLASVGVAALNMQIQIETSGGTTNEPFVKGEIIVKGPGVMLGYYNNPEATAFALRDGFLHTGDIGYLDNEGCLYICGRVRNIILVRGFTVYAEEIEAALLSSGLVRDCLVYGERDDISGERVLADVIPASTDTTAADIYKYCIEHLASYKLPQNIKLVDSIQKTATGKSVVRR